MKRVVRTHSGAPILMRRSSADKSAPVRRGEAGGSNPSVAANLARVAQLESEHSPSKRMCEGSSPSPCASSSLATLRRIAQGVSRASRAASTYTHPYRDVLADQGRVPNWLSDDLRTRRSRGGVLEGAGEAKGSGISRLVPGSQVGMRCPAGLTRRRDA